MEQPRPGRAARASTKPRASTGPRMSTKPRGAAPAGSAGPRPIDLGPLPTVIGYKLRRAQLAVFAEFRKVFAASDIRPAQYAALTVIQRNPGLKQAELCAALGVKRANFAALFEPLERHGLAARRTLAGDRRSNALTLTAKGEAAMRRIEAKHAALEARIVSRIGTAGRDALVELLDRLSEIPSDDP